MLKDPTARKVVGIILAVLLSACVIVEFVFISKSVQQRYSDRISAITSLSKKLANEDVVVPELVQWPEVESVDVGEVFGIKDSGIRVRVPGTISSKTNTSTGTYVFTLPEEEDSLVISLTADKLKDDDYKYLDAYSKYWYGGTDIEDLLLPNQADSILMQQTFLTGNIPFIYSETANKYVALVPDDDDFYMLSCATPFNITMDKVTVNYLNPSDDPMLHHTYSDYEELAALNQINKLEKGEATISPYQSAKLNGGSSGSAIQTYTSLSDDKIRDQLVEYAKFKWRKDGTADGTTTVIDTTSSKAKQSEWIFTETTFSYDYAGLQLINLNASVTKRGEDVSAIDISGNIINELDDTRPYVIVVKYIDENHALLGLQVIDCRESPLSAKQYGSFHTSVSAADISVGDCVGVQFEVY